jgi:hypothetical protein
VIPQLIAKAVLDGAAAELAAVASAAVRGLSLGLSVEVDAARLEALGKRAKVAVMKGAARAAKPVRAAVQGHAGQHQRYGFLAKSIGTKTRVYPGGRFVTVVGPKMSFSRVKGRYTRGPRAGQGKRQVPYLYAWLIEKGTRRSRAFPFLRPAHEAAGKQFPAAAAREINRELALAD